MTTQFVAICIAGLTAWYAASPGEYTINYTEIKAAGEGRMTFQFKEKKVSLIVLLNDLKNPDEDVRMRAARAISRPEKWPKKDTQALVRALAERLSDEIPELQYHAADALSRVGEDAVLAVDELMEAASDKSALTRSRALLAVSKIGPKAKTAVPNLINSLDDELDPIRGAAALALGNIGPDAVPALIEALKSPKHQVRNEAAYALAVMGPRARAALSVLKEMIQDRSREVARSARMAIAEIEQTPGRPGIHFPGRIEQSHR